jgi:hypothetical protein
VTPHPAVALVGTADAVVACGERWGLTFIIVFFHCGGVQEKQRGGGAVSPHFDKRRLMESGGM